MQSREPANLLNQAMDFVYKQCRLKEQPDQCGSHRQEMYQILGTLAADISNDIEGRKSQVLLAINAEHAFRRCCSQPIDWVTKIQEHLGQYAFLFNPDDFSCRPAYYHTEDQESNGLQCIAKGKFQSSHVFTKPHLQSSYRLMPFCRMLDTYCRRQLRREINEMLWFRSDETPAEPEEQAGVNEGRENYQVLTFQECCSQYDNILASSMPPGYGCQLTEVSRALARGAFAGEADTPHLLSAHTCGPALRPDHTYRLKQIFD